jgi:hypothetical protein
MDGHVEAGLAPGAFLVADVDLRGGIVAGKNDIERGRTTHPRSKLRDSRPDLGSDGRGDRRAVQSSSRHETRPTPGR